MMRMAMVTTTNTTMDTITVTTTGTIMDTTMDTTMVKLLESQREETLLSSSALILIKTLQIVEFMEQAVRKFLTPSQLLTWLVVSLKIACLLVRMQMATLSCFPNLTTILPLNYKIMNFQFQPWIKLKQA